MNLSTNIDKNRFEYNVEVILYRICCELVNNSLKYAQANRINIMLTEFNNKLDFKYDDNGIGFCLEKVENKGMGLTNIKSRVTSLNGSVILESSPLKGFRNNFV